MVDGSVGGDAFVGFADVQSYLVVVPFGDGGREACADGVVELHGCGRASLPAA